MVSPVSASVKATANTAPGSNLEVTWTGPDYRTDYLSISRIGDTGYEVFRYSKDGSPLILKVPDQPGDYEVRYVMGKDRLVLARQALSVQ